MQERIQMQNERLHLRSPNIHVCFKVGIIGVFTKNDFVCAIQTVSQKHPMLKSTIKFDKDYNAWYLLDNGSIGLEFLKGDETTWLQWYEKNDNIPFDFKNGPLVRIGIIFKEKETDIIILGHHILGDGIGYLNLVKDVLAAIDNSLDGMLQLLPIENEFQKKTKLRFLEKSFAKKLNNTWRIDRKTFSETEYLAFFKYYREKYPPGIHLGVLESNNLTNLLISCKKYGITVNEAIATAFIAALQKVDNKYNGKNIRLGTAANIRNELFKPIPDCMGNFVTGISCEVKYDYNKTFVYNAKYIGKKLRKKLNNPKSRYLVLNFLNALDKDFIESAIYASYGDYDIPVSKKLGEIIGEQPNNKGIGISNLGKQVMETYNTIKVKDILFIPPAFPANLINIGVMTINSCLTFCLRYAKTEISDCFAEQISEQTIKYLSEFT